MSHFVHIKVEIDRRKKLYPIVKKAKEDGSAVKLRQTLHGWR